MTENTLFNVGKWSEIDFVDLYTVPFHVFNVLKEKKAPEDKIPWKHPLYKFYRILYESMKYLVWSRFFLIDI